LDKYHASQHLGYNLRGHTNFDFLDINLRDDNEIFIDPCLFEYSAYAAATEARVVLQSFFDELYKALRDGDHARFRELLRHAGERNATKLGYGNGENGHGSTEDGLADKLAPLWKLIKKIPFEKPLDIPVFIRGFDKDGLSDLITNVISKQLLNFTIDQCAKINAEVNMKTLTPMQHWYWDPNKSNWVREVTKYATYNAKQLLLVPKDCVRRDYAYDVDDYISMAILERRKQETKYTDASGKEKYGTTKKDLGNAIPKDEKTWRYDYSAEYTRRNPEALAGYHRRISSRYVDKSLTNEQLDALIY
jgi:hypothetical protein